MMTDQYLSDLTRDPIHLAILSRVEQLNEKNLSAVLSDDELKRAGRYKRQADRTRSVCSHGIKRVVIGKYLNIAPHSLKFEEGPYGKPLCIEPGAPHFNLSHSGNWVAIAVSSAGEVGIDVEFPAPFSFRDLASEVLSEYSAAELQQSGSWFDFLFFWTQKESVAKACGLGMSLDFKMIETKGGTGQQRISVNDTAYQVVSLPIADGVVSFASDAQRPVAWYELLDYPLCRVRGVRGVRGQALNSE